MKTMLVAAVAASLTVASAWAQAPAPTTAAAERGVPLPTGYVIGTDDVLSVYVWNEKEMSGDATVRPDGKITLPLLNDVHAAGLTPPELSVHLAKLATRFLQGEPQVTVSVKEIRSRKVYILGEVSKPGHYPLNVDMTVLQLIGAAGGLLEWAKKDEIVIVRTENGVETRFKFNYNDVTRGKNVKQNILLKPGDTVIVFD